MGLARLVPVLGDGHIQAQPMRSMSSVADPVGWICGDKVQGHDAVEGVRQVMRDRAADESNTTPGHEAGTSRGSPLGSRSTGHAVGVPRPSLFSALAELIVPAEPPPSTRQLVAHHLSRSWQPSYQPRHLGAPAHVLEGLGDEVDDDTGDLLQRHRQGEDDDALVSGKRRRG